MGNGRTLLHPKNTPQSRVIPRFTSVAMHTGARYLDRGLQGSVGDAVCAAEQNGESESVCESHLSDPLPLVPLSRAVLGGFSDEVTAAGFQMAHALHWILTSLEGRRLLKVRRLSS